MLIFITYSADYPGIAFLGSQYHSLALATEAYLQTGLYLSVMRMWPSHSVQSGSGGPPSNLPQCRGCRCSEWAGFHGRVEEWRSYPAGGAKGLYGKKEISGWSWMRGFREVLGITVYLRGLMAQRSLKSTFWKRRYPWKVHFLPR